MKTQYEPTFEISESQIVNLGDKKIGERVTLILDCSAIEKTKNYVMLKVKFGYMLDSKRKF